MLKTVSWKLVVSLRPAKSSQIEGLQLIIPFAVSWVCKIKLEEKFPASLKIDF